MVVRLHIARLKANAQARPAGYVDFVLARGKVDGEHVELDLAALNDLYEKFPEPLATKPPVEPGLVKMSADFATAMAGWAKTGFKRVDKEVYESREVICLGCEHWDARARAGLGKCKVCGCTKAKLWLPAAHCPLQPPKW